MISRCSLPAEDDLSELAGRKQPYSEMFAGSIPSIPRVCGAMPTDDLLDQFLAETSGKRAWAQ